MEVVEKCTIVVIIRLMEKLSYVKQGRNWDYKNWEMEKILTTKGIKRI